MSLRVLALLAVASLPAAVTAQSAPAAAPASPPPPVAEQLVAAVLPLPKEMRDGAGVMGYKTAGKLEVLRATKNGMICLADDPSDDQFHVACYAESMEPFMARGRALRAAGIKGDAVDTARFAEVKKGTLKMPTSPATMYQLFGPKGDFNAATGTAPKSKALFVVYMPFATSASSGLSAQPGPGKPWIMHPGTPKAHIMFQPGM